MDKRLNKIKGQETRKRMGKEGEQEGEVMPEEHGKEGKMERMQGGGKDKEYNG